ncbi:hypothetical protein BJ138DRAFT_1142473 [Hygrophoropsis aurantiaca]|uniref:Uncharacterized protein n=1 Tax=Hygrophoropsis aurantiaca TaxID=72124 RepID=A0ACB8AQ46_9AGAM|nr:hypothetical protein BJ138DRAFT_1142473 [Hygrophoropsis aurantiaca]
MPAPREFECRVYGCDRWFGTLAGRDQHQSVKHRRQNYYLKPGPVIPSVVVVKSSIKVFPPSSPANETSTGMSTSDKRQADEGDREKISSAGALAGPRSSIGSALRIHCRLCRKDPGEDLTATTCGHIFCNQCIVEELGVQSACPACEATVSVSSLICLDLTI